MKNPALVDVSVLIIFFNRPETLAQVFAQVRAARPSRLFLYQDGPRSEADMAGIRACRDVVANVDWQCDVRTLYQADNYGCDPSEYIAQKWAFGLTEKCIVLEDDDVPSVSFFAFCKTLLDRYADDERVWMIQGFNPEGHTPDVASDYFFTTNFSIWGWASWRRVVDTWDERYAWMDDEETMRRLAETVRNQRLRRDFLPLCRAHKQSGKAYYETIFWASMLLGNGLAVCPVNTLINNLGATPGSTHFGASTELLPHGYRRIFTMKRAEVAFPLRHPAHVMENTDYRRRVYRIMGWNHPLVKVGRSFEELWLNLRRGQWGNIRRAATNRLRKWMGRRKDL